MWYLTPGNSPFFLGFKVWHSLARSLLLSPLQAREGAVGCGLPLFPPTGRRFTRGSRAQAVGRGCNWQACPHPKPPNSLPGAAASHTWMVRRGTELLAGTISCSSQVSAGVERAVGGHGRTCHPAVPLKEAHSYLELEVGSAAPSPTSLLHGPRSLGPVLPQTAEP